MDYVESFADYLKSEKHMSENSFAAYQRDVKDFLSFLRERGMMQAADASNTEVVAYLLALKNEGRSGATVNRKVASIRAFYNFLIVRGVVGENPTVNIKSPKIQRKEIEYLSIGEVEKLLSMPDDSVKGVRDRALLELLYAAGVRVSEAAAANVEDINLRIGFITCSGEHGKARIIPLGRPARAAMENYIYEGRAKLLREKEDQGALFLNYYGERLTRQGVWKVMKDYGKQAGFEHELSPQILRNSFAVHMIQNGADLKTLQELLGHEDITATQIYLSVTKNRIKEVYDNTHPRA
ncbi:site-specific tyrosine recombinase [Bacilliculturomica massiliensis]|uniref:site-specific tyrosine recombinase n=1 Tax=Bacilliculturomica massiliensis TaxID=1917867 RepID=UPI00102FE679|nr:site-specific tyrosine recombinase [Bacilliculturomica massiliensis]